MSREKRDYHYTPEQIKRMEMRKKRVAMRRKKERQKRMLFAVGILIFVLLCIGGISALRKSDDNEEEVARVDQARMSEINDGNAENANEPEGFLDVSQ